MISPYNSPSLAAITQVGHHALFCCCSLNLADMKKERADEVRSSYELEEELKDRNTYPNDKSAYGTIHSYPLKIFSYIVFHHFD